MWPFRRRSPGREPVRRGSVPVRPNGSRERAAREALASSERATGETEALVRRGDLLAAEVRRALGGHA